MCRVYVTQCHSYYNVSRSTNVIPVYDIQNKGLWKQVLEVSVSYTYTHIHIMADKKKKVIKPWCVSLHCLNW